MVAPIRTSKDWAQSFDDIIDVRSPAEFADDHIPGAINLPVLNDDQRAEVGTIYKQVSPFKARRIGAKLISENIARHLDQELADKPASWKPLVYCWRGGQRSGSMARIMAEIGWVVTLLEGGYKTYRNDVSEQLEDIASKLELVLLQGPTGSAKTHVLNAAKDAGVQVIDLEGLAQHRGSLLGNEPGIDQPPQRMFESLLFDVMKRLDPARPVLVEAESSRIGSCHIPRGLWKMMTGAEQIHLAASLPARVDFLIRDYPHLLADPTSLRKLIDGMVSRHGHEVTASWRGLLDSKDWQGLVSALIQQHYDPAYANTSSRKDGNTLASLTAEDLNQPSINALAQQISGIFSKK